MKNTRNVFLLDNWKMIAPMPKQGQFAHDLAHLKDWHATAQLFLNTLPSVVERTDEHWRTARSCRDAFAEVRGRFVSVHGLELYAELTNGWTERLCVETLIYKMADRYPCLAPTRKEVDDDMNYSLKHKFGHELSQGFILSELLAIPRIGYDLMLAMLQPKFDSLNLLEEFQAVGELDLGLIRLFRKGTVGYLILSNQKYLNAEDDELNSAMESAVDLILLDPRIKVGVIRGDLMEHEKYRGKRVFCSGVNLTKLYSGQLPYMFYVSRELGLVSKIFRGLLKNGIAGDGYFAIGYEKPWISVVDGHAIGGGCQLALVSDFVIAEKGSYFSLPAANEGFVPGVANLRLPYYVGRRLANRMIYLNNKIMANSPVGYQLVDEVVEPNAMNSAIDNLTEEIQQISSQGIKSNRKAFLSGMEPKETFINYMATFCREQALCMFNMDIIDNLERNWVNR